MALEHLVALAGGDPRNLRRAGLAHLSSQSPRAAAAYFARLLAEKPGDFEAHLRIAQAFLDIYAAEPRDAGDLLRKARRHVEQAAAARPNDPEVRRLRARLATEPP